MIALAGLGEDTSAHNEGQPRRDDHAPADVPGPHGRENGRRWMRAANWTRPLLTQAPGDGRRTAGFL